MLGLLEGVDAGAEGGGTEGQGGGGEGEVEDAARRREGRG